MESLILFFVLFCFVCFRLNIAYHHTDTFVSTTKLPSHVCVCVRQCQSPLQIEPFIVMHHVCCRVYINCCTNIRCFVWRSRAALMVQCLHPCSICTNRETCFGCDRDKIGQWKRVAKTNILTHEKYASPLPKRVQNHNSLKVCGIP